MCSPIAAEGRDSGGVCSGAAPVVAGCRLQPVQRRRPRLLHVGCLTLLTVKDTLKAAQHRQLVSGKVLVVRPQLLTQYQRTTMPFSVCSENSAVLRCCPRMSVCVAALQHLHSPAPAADLPAGQQHLQRRPVPRLPCRPASGAQPRAVKGVGRQTVHS